MKRIITLIIVFAFSINLFAQTDYYNVKHIRFFNHANNRVGSIYHGLDGTGRGLEFLYGTEENSPQMSVLSDKVEVNTNLNVSGYIKFSQISSTKLNLWGQGSNMSGFGISNNQINYHAFDSSNDHVFYAGGTNGDGTELARIKGTGSLGIGTNNPLTKLHVVGDGSLTAKFIFKRSNNTGEGEYITNSFNSSSNTDWGLSFIAGSSERLRIKADGKIGIGTSSPQELLEIKEANPVLSLHNTNQGAFKIGVDGPVFKIAAMDNGFGGHSGSFVSNDSQVLAMTKSGSVGIGTINPDKGKLHIKGSVHVENDNGTQVFHISAGKQLVFVGDSAWIHYQNSLSNPSSPIQQNLFSMWVSKGIVTQDIAIVNPDKWSDFVFEKEYILRSLEEVAAYIRANGHLPDMPSESEIKAQGYSLHEINKKLLQKIEELTLYAIQQEEKLKNQEKLFSTLEQRIKQLEDKH